MEMTEKTIKSDLIYEGRIINVRRDEIELPNGLPGIREVVDHHGGVCVAPLTSDGELIFVEQFRYPYMETVLELPAGKLEKGEDAFEAGKRELEEETGCVADNYIDCGKFYPSPGYCGEIIHLYAASGLHKTAMNLDEDEFLEVKRIPVEKAVDMVMKNEIKDGKTQALILKVANLIKEGRI